MATRRKSQKVRVNLSSETRIAPIPKIFQLDIAHQSPSGAIFKTAVIWERKRRSPRAVAEWISAYCRAIEPGGQFERVTKELGYTPYPISARLHSGGRTLAAWSPNVVSIAGYA